jgi:hypothetical protein
LVIFVGSSVILFGLFRIRLGLRSKSAEETAIRVGGLNAYPRRTQILYGVVYLLLGIMLILGAAGVKMPWMR